MPQTAGTSDTFDLERTSHQQTNPCTDYVACFTTDTRIRTKAGDRPVQGLKSDALLALHDSGYAYLRMVLRSRVTQRERQEQPNLRPVRIRAGALGDGLPARDLVVSPQHRMLCTSSIARQMFGTRNVLVAARKLIKIPGVHFCEQIQALEFVHIVMDRRRVIFAEDALIESFCPRRTANRYLPPAARGERSALFPQSPGDLPKWGQHIPQGRTQKQFVECHQKNAKPRLKMTRILRSAPPYSQA